MDAGNTASPTFRYSLLLREIDSMRSSTSAIALVLIHLDGLSDINDKFGYLAGDRVLAELAERMAEVGREQDRVLPVKGTSFALIIHNPLHEGHAVLGADKVARVASEPFLIGSNRARVRVRMGISLLPEPAETAEELLNQCELALHTARARDEDYVVYTDALVNREAGVSHAWFDIEEGLRQGEFEMHYQPKIALAAGTLYGAEALVRWNSPVSGYIPPDAFLPAIEHTQEIRALLWFALNASLRQAAEWLAVVPDFRMAVNVATGNLEDVDLPALVADALNIWQFPPEQLVLEVTETALMKDAEGSIAMLNELRELGVRISIDDFGTGYSSLSYLKTLPADELKIDRSFISNMATDETDQQLVESVISLGHAVHLKVVAEGIETEAVNALLMKFGCDIGQGWYFDRALPGHEFARKWITGEALPAADQPTAAP